MFKLINSSVKHFCLFGKGRGKVLANSALLFVLSAIFALSAFPLGNVFAENKTGAEYDDVSVDFTGQNEGYSAVLYNNSNGLPTSEANAIAETSEGFIWIGSYSGLIRYDGNTFERIDSTTGITSVSCLYVDSKNRLWIGTNDNGIAIMNKGKYTVYKQIGELQSSIRCITEDLNGKVYIATTHGIGVADEAMNLYPLNEPQISNEYVDELRTDTNTGIVYGITQDGDVFTIEDEKITSYYEGSRLVGGEYAANSILPDPNNPGYVYIGTEGSEVFYGNLKTGMADSKKINVAPLFEVNSLEYIDDKLWICSDTGIGFYDYTGFRKLNNLPMNNSIDQMLTDYEGNLWFSSSRQGVLKIVRNRFTDIFAKYNLDEKVVNSTCKYKSYLLLGTDTGLIAIDGGTQTDRIAIRQKYNVPQEYEECKNLIEMLDGVRIRSVIKDSDDVVWISTYSELGLIKLDDGNITVFNHSSGLPSNKVRAVSEGSDGKHYAACSDGVAVIENDTVTDVFDTNSGITNPEILTVCEGFNKEIVMGTDGGGICIIKGNQITNLSRDEGLSSLVVLRIKRDRTRKLYWIVTSNSIAYMTDDYQVTTIQNFPYSNNFDLYENSHGEMWILSSNGVYVTSAEELIANEEIKPIFYSMDNGLSCVTTANSYSELTDEGDLYISGSTGVSKVNIEQNFDKVEEIKMAVPYVEADGLMIYADESGTITVPASTKRLTVYGFIYTYSLMNPKVTYYLEGFEKETTTVKRSELEPVDYTNLKGGTYHFVMSLQDQMGRGENELTATIVKKKALYETFIFRFLVVCLIVFVISQVIINAVKLKTQALMKKQNENRRFIREMIEAIAKTIDMKDRYTKGHSVRVAKYTAMLAKELGYDEEDVEKYYNIALLHDIGKIGIKPEVLNKEGKLTDEEFTIIKSHSTQGYNVLKDIKSVPELATGAYCHHERPDGKGYPRGLKGDEIPRVAQIIAVADTFDAMYSDRPYRKRMNFDKVVSIIKEVSGTQLTADVVDAFLRLVEKGEFRDPSDNGGGSTDDIDNIHRKYAESEKKEKADEEKSDKEDVKKEEKQ